MTRQLWTIQRDANMTQAHQVMRQHHIRHLPVLEGAKLVGIVSERDLHLLETLPDANPDEISVSEAMIEDVYSASPDDGVADVVQRMADFKLGSVVVCGKQGVEGIFTAVDALQVLADLLQRAA